MSRMVDEEHLEILAHEKIEEKYTVQKYIEEEETENDNGGGSSKFDDQIEGKEGEGKEGNQRTMVDEVGVRIRGIQPTLFELQLNDNNAKAEGAAAIFGIAGAMQELQVLSLNKNNIDASLLASYATNKNTAANATNKDHKTHKQHKQHKQHKHPNSAVAHKDLRHRGSIGNLGRNHLHRHVHHTEASNRIRAPICQGISMMIEEHTSLTALHLNNNKLGDAGATSIGNALAHNIVLTDLQLNW